MAWIDPNLSICYGIYELPKCNTNFRGRILLADAHSKHILIILVVDLVAEFQKVTGMIFWIWTRWEHDTKEQIQKATDKKVEFQQDEHFDSSEFHIMAGVITNDAILSL